MTAVSQYRIDRPTAGDCTDKQSQQSLSVRQESFDRPAETGSSIGAYLNTAGRFDPGVFTFQFLCGDMAQRQSCECCGSETGEIGTETDPSVSCYCPIDGVIDAISKKYSLQIVGLLGGNGPMRYSELEDVLEATSSSVLSNRLEELADEELIERRSFDEIPPRVEYSLTPRGRELEIRIQPLLEWAAGD